jgi:hypothetical protein
MVPSRRSFLEFSALLWSQAVAQAQQHAHSTAGTYRTKRAYSFGFFTPMERELVRSLAARIVPANERSGGSEAARVDEYVDFVLSHGAEELRRRWHDGLARLAPRIKGRSAAEIDALLTAISKNEFEPSVPDEEFFVLLKSAVVDGFYTSEEGIKRELGYLGNGFLRDFPGCTHTSHKTPDDYTPLLRQRKQM